MEKQISDNRRMPLLDALRTVAAIGVMLHHTPNLLGQPLLFSRTYLFVDLFFLLSGFVLTLSAEPKMRAGLSAAGFMRARIIRLWPIIAVASLAGAAVFATQGNLGQVLGLLVLALCLIPVFGFDTAIYPLNGPQWSLLWELIANLVHGLLLSKLGSRGLVILAATSGLLLIAAIEFAGWNGFGPNADYWWLAPPRIAWSYILGVWMARRWAERRPVPIVEWRIALMLPLVALVTLPWLPLSLAAGDMLAVIVVLPCLFWVAVATRPPRDQKIGLERVGAISFPIYALHLPCILGSIFLVGGRSRLSELLGVAACLALSVMIVWLGPKLRRAIRQAMIAARDVKTVTA